MEPLEQSALALQAMLDSKQISAAEVMQATLAQIDAVNGLVNAVVSLRDQDALMAEAAQAESKAAQAKQAVLERQTRERQSGAAGGVKADEPRPLCRAQTRQDLRRDDCSQALAPRIAREAGAARGAALGAGRRTQPGLA